jgi:arylsulfatase A-like enzyme
MGMKLPYDVYMSCHPFALPKTETTVAQLLKGAGYRTGIVGKWHLGLNEQHYTDGVNLPHSYGFDDVRTILPTTLSWNCDIDKARIKRDKCSCLLTMFNMVCIFGMFGVQRHRQFPLRRSCFLYRNRTIVQQPIDLHHASATLANDAKAFIHDHADHPFFLYFAPLQAHTAMHNMPHFTNKSRRGTYT